MKNLMIKCVESGTCQYEAFLEQRNTPRQDAGLSPTEMLFGWKGRTKIPSLSETSNTPSKRRKRKLSVKQSYDKRSKDLTKLSRNQPVYFQHKTNLWQKGKVIDMTHRNYTIRSEDGAEYKRNRVHIRPTSVEYRNRDISPLRYEHLPNNQNNPTNSPTKTNTGDQQLVKQPIKQPEEQPVKQPDVQTRLRRNAKAPAYLKDYVTK